MIPNFKTARLMAVLCLAASVTQAEELTIGSFAQGLDQALSESVARPWEELGDHDAKVLTYEPGAWAVQAEMLDMDVITLSGQQLAEGCADSRLKPLDGGNSPCGLPFVTYGRTIAYSERGLDGDAPSGVQAFFDTRGYPGKRLVPDDPKMLFEMALLADGADPSEIYDLLATDEGRDRAINRLNELGDDLTFAEPWTIASALDQGEAGMGLTWLGQMPAPGNGGVRPAGQVLFTTQDYMAVLQSSRKSALAQDFMAYASDPSVVNDFSDLLNGYRDDTGRPPIWTVQACGWEGGCPCKGGRCDDECCEKGTGQGQGHFPTDPLFWAENEGAIRDYWSQRRVQ